MDTLRPLLLALILGEFFLETAADALNRASFRMDVPAEFAHLVDPAQHARSQAYLRTTTDFELLRRSVQLVAFLIFLFAGGFDWADQLARHAFEHPIARGLVFAGILALLKGALQLPFSIHSTFRIEERFGFNRQTPGLFASDLIKAVALGALLGGPLLAAVLWLFERAGATAWLWAWGVMTGFQVLVLFLAPVVIMPLFNKFSPLPEGPLRSDIIAYLRREKFEVSGVFTMDGSKRSTKANAFFTGFGRFRRLVFFDTLLQKNSPEEIVAVLAHEIGHFKRGHIPKSVALSVATSFALFYVLGRLIADPALFRAFGVTEISSYAGLIFASVLYSPVLRLLSVLTLWLSRKFEYEADEYSLRTNPDPGRLATALQKLSVDSLSNLTPHPLKVWLDYSHPPVIARIRAMQALTRESVSGP